MLSRPENIIRKIGVCLLVPTIKQANLHLQTMSWFSSTELGRPTTHQQRTTCECLWSQSGDLWIQARTIWQDHLWSHFVSPQYRNRFRWRPKKVYSINYTYIYTATPQHVTLPSQPFWFYTSLPVGGKNCSKEVVKSFTSVVENCVFGGKGLAVQKVEKNKRRDVRNQKLQMKDIYTCIQMWVLYIYIYM